MRPPLIEEHGVIGNMRTAALVSLAGTIDFYCFPDFDSPSVFAELLDAEKGGGFSIQPRFEAMRTRQLYLPETNVLMTRFLSASGLVELTDFMPVLNEPGEARPGSVPRRYNQIVRNVRVVRGEVTLTLRCAPRFDYARSAHSVTQDAAGFVFQPEAEGVIPMRLYSPVPLSLEQGDVAGEFTLKGGESATFTFGGVEQEGRCGMDQAGFDACLSETAQYWRKWLATSHYQGRWREIVHRSALILKLCSNHEHGSLIAAPTFGLPERLGGARNWDYRFSWLRDSAFTLYAFMRLGFTEEVRKFGGWMKLRIESGLKEHAPNGPLKPMYRVYNTAPLPEVVLDNLAGYCGSRPVRVGNAAETQLQLDIYGELLDSIYLSSKYANGLSNDGWKRMKELLAWLADNWERPDEGIWEVRNEPQEFLHSRLMCWVAFDRAIRLSEKRSLVAPVAAWRAVRDKIHEDIFDNFWNEPLQSFVQSKGSDTLDASVLLMPLVRFINPTDPRWLSTLAAIERHLSEDGIVYRYTSGIDGLDGHEGGFLACSFWLIECLARSGQVDKAQLLFGKVLGYANHLGLYSEELGSNGDQLGNFPQALTHLALISAACYLDRRLSGTSGDTWQ